MELKVSDLACARGGVPVLERVSFTLPPGQALVLRGPNGIGKTTLLRSIAGLQPWVSGQVAPGPEAMAYAGHADGVKASLTVTENLSFWAEVYGISDISTALAAFDLGPLAERQAENLSAGQKRRLGLARLLVTGRKIWVLDEPTVSLDANATAGFATVLAAHLVSGGSALIASHIGIGLKTPELDLTPHRARAQSTADVFLDGAMT